MSTKFYSDDEVVQLSVGGKTFSTQVGTLRKFPDSKFAHIFSEDEPTSVPENGVYFFDRFENLRMFPFPSDSNSVMFFVFICMTVY